MKTYLAIGKLTIYNNLPSISILLFEFQFSCYVPDNIRLIHTLLIWRNKFQDCLVIRVQIFRIVKLQSNAPSSKEVTTYTEGLKSLAFLIVLAKSQFGIIPISDFQSRDWKSGLINY